MKRPEKVTRFVDGRFAHVGTCAEKAARADVSFPPIMRDDVDTPLGFVCRYCGGGSARPNLVRGEPRPRKPATRPVDTLRRVIFRPYLPGRGPAFRLHTWSTGRVDYRGCTVIGYTLSEHVAGKPGRVIFRGDDFRPSPMDADDSDASVRALMGFLTLRKGDTDADYFAGYTPEQTAFAEEHAETLSAEVYARFGED